MKTYVVNKCEKNCVKIFLHYINIAIFSLGYFILLHPVEIQKCSRKRHVCILNAFGRLPLYLLQ